VRFLTETEQRTAEALVARPGRLSPAEWALVGAYLETAPATSEEEFWLLEEQRAAKAAAQRTWRLETIAELERFGMMTKEFAATLREQEDAS
jgi:hypothetical protein